MISIIVPVYNAENVIEQTLQSLLTQTYTDFEVICVNDGSTDSSLERINTIAGDDSRVVVLNQANAGVSVARNSGIAVANGDIAMFVDADDSLVSEACEFVAKTFEEQQCDVLTFGLQVEPPEAAPVILKREMIPSDKVFNGFKPELLFKEYSRPYACRTAVKMNLLKDHSIGFEPGVKLGEDQIFYFDIYPWSKKTVLSSRQLYIYNMRNESATHTITVEDQLESKLEQHLLVISSIAKHWEQFGFPAKFCASELLEWFIDFLTLDINKLSLEKKNDYFRRLLSILDDYFGDAHQYAVRRPTKLILNNIRKVSEKRGDISKINLVRFYYMRRGFRKCVERVVLGRK